MLTFQRPMAVAAIVYRYVKHKIVVRVVYLHRFNPLITFRK